MTLDSELDFEPRPWVDGQWIRCSSSSPVFNPANGEVIAQVEEADKQCIADAIAGAVRAQHSWESRSPFERGAVVSRIGYLLRERCDPLARLLTQEQGKPLAQAKAEIEYAASFFQWFGDGARRSLDRLAPHTDPAREYSIEYRSIGVVGLFTPWNFPLAQGAKKMAAALAAGCSMLWKPSEQTPLVALAMAPILEAAGVPRGTVQLVPGSGSMIGSLVTEDSRVALVSLTGSTRTGAALLALCAPTIKRVTLELGGNAPFVILPNSDIEAVADDLVRMKLFVSGQVCVTANRIFAHRSQRVQLVDALIVRLRKVRMGNGLEAGIDVGPLIHHQACERITALVRSAVAQGASLAYALEDASHDSKLSQGSYFPPTILTHVDDAMAVAQEEVFGPVFSVLEYDEIEEVIDRANATRSGLAGFVYGSEIHRCRAIARALQVGIVGVNEWRPLKAEIPFGGIKQSGMGWEGGDEGLREFLRIQVISAPKPKI